MRIAFALAASAAALVAGMPAAAVTFTNAQIASANSGLSAMRELNAIVLGNLSASNEIEGKTFVGGNISGTTENFGIGNASYGFTQGTRQVLTVGGYVSSNININNGQNGTNGNVITSSAQNTVSVGGDMTGQVGMNSAANGLTGQVQTGGSFNNQSYNPSSTKTAQYGTTASNVQAQDSAYVTQNTALANATTGLAKTIANETTALRTNVTQLSQILSTLTTNATLNLTDRNDIHFDYGPGSSTADYVVVNVNASDLFNGGGTANFNLLTQGAGYKTTIVNVLGTGNYTWAINNNDNQNSNDQNIIWNFSNATLTPVGGVYNSVGSLTLNTGFHGSVLAPDWTVSNSNIIEGSLVANLFNQGGEVHLGTYAGTSSIIPSATAVPEPASWAMMVAGFGLIGGTMRAARRKPAVVIA